MEDLDMDHLTLRIKIRDEDDESSLLDLLEENDFEYTVVCD